ncbi:MAG: FtsK/SpoIIIE domain-containing protein [Romboutsia timonensis]|jgi:DNA translocase stage III sporulation protein|uniref:FtsK/SpoIIIE domain-containing protein n=1 Tax=Romboutsia timonensis TaxID=1776391 RepID=UPI003996721E
MSNDVNLFTPLVDSLVDSGKIASKHIKKILGLNILDFNKLFEELNICNKSKEYPKLYNVIHGEYFKVYQFTIPVGLSIEDFKEHTEAISHFIGVDNVSIVRNYKLIEFKILIRVPYEEYDPEAYKAKGYKIPIGIDLDKYKIRYWDLSDGANANCYIAGSTRCGKSNILRLIMAILTQKSCADIQFSLINPKRVDLIEFKNVKNTRHYTEDPDEAADILLENIKEMQRRYILFTKNKVKTIWDYRNKIDKMPVRLVVIEEMSTFEGNNKFHEALRLIAQQGAGAGILLLLTTQLPNKDTVPNLTKNNINTVIGGKCKDAIRSDIIVEDGDLHLLRGKGHMKVFDCDDYGTEIQVFWIDDDIVERITQNNFKRSFKQNKRAIDAGTSITQGDNNIPG